MSDLLRGQWRSPPANPFESDPRAARASEAHPVPSRQPDTPAAAAPASWEARSVLLFRRFAASPGSVR